MQRNEVVICNFLQVTVIKIDLKNLLKQGTGKCTKLGEKKHHNCKEWVVSLWLSGLKTFPDPHGYGWKKLQWKNKALLAQGTFWGWKISWKFKDRNSGNKRIIERMRPKFQIQILPKFFLTAKLCMCKREFMRPNTK